MALDFERKSSNLHFSYIGKENNPSFTLENVNDLFPNSFNKYNTRISPLDDVKKYEVLGEELPNTEYLNEKIFLESTLLNSRYLFAKELFLGKNIDTEKRVELYEILHDNPRVLEFGNRLHNKIGRYSSIDKIVDDSINTSTKVNPDVFLTTKEDGDSYLEKVASEYNARLTLP